MMGVNTKIGWCDSTVSLWWGCQEVAPECDFCYAKFLAKRVGKGRAWEDVRFDVPSAFAMLDKLQRLAEKSGTLHTVFMQSMGDIFEISKPMLSWHGEETGQGAGAKRQRCFEDIGEGRWPNIVFLMLTKRPGLIRDFVPATWLESWPANVWTGTSVGSQQSVPQIERLAKAPGKHFVSFEPLLEAIDASDVLWSDCPDCEGRGDLGAVLVPGFAYPQQSIGRTATCERCGGTSGNAGSGSVPLDAIHWAIVGCESRGQRVGRLPNGLQVAWNNAAARLVRDLREADVPTYVKQVPIDGLVSEEPNPQWDSRLVYREFPQWLPETADAA